MKQYNHPTLLFCLLLGLLPLTIHAQDFQLWTGATVEATFGKRLGASFSQEARFDHNWRQLKYNFSEVGIAYELNKSFEASVIHRLLFLPEYYKPIHRSALGLKYKSKWTIQKKNILKYGVKGIYQRKFYGSEYKLPANTLRLKLELKYSRKIKKSKRKKLNIKRKVSILEPFVLAEGFYSVRPSASYFKRYRLALGTKINIAKNQSLKVKYIFQQNFDDFIDADYALNLSYAITIKALD